MEFWKQILLRSPAKKPNIKKVPIHWDAEIQGNVVTSSEAE